MARWIPHRNFLGRRALSTSVVVLALGGVCARANADEPAVPVSQLGLDPSSPQTQPLPGGTQPSFEGPSEKEDDWRFGFHGLITAPLRAGINTRDNPRPGQSSTVLHAPPVVPDDLTTFSHTGVVQTPFTQLNFSYGNNIVTGTVTVVAKVDSVSAGFLDPSAQLGINDAFVTLNLPNIGKNMLFRVNVGAFSNRYGQMGEYDLGRYGTPLIAAINGVGENIQATFGFKDFTLLLEQGIQGLSNKPGGGITPDGWNGFADQRVGSSFVTHEHAGLNFKRIATLGAHYIHAFSQDDRGASPLPDGKISVLAADLRLELARFGYFYAGYANTNAKDSDSVGRIVQVLNTQGGAGLEQYYFGSLSQGTGKLNTFGAQYDLSIGRLVSYPVPFNADGPDVFVSLFGLYTKVSSPDPRYDNVKKYKVGVEATYSLLPWLAASARYDRVTPDTGNARKSFAVISPRVIFRTGWNARNQVVLQYSHWLNGSLTTVEAGYPPHEDVTVIPDENMISLSASMWW